MDLTCTEQDHVETGNGPDSTMKPGRVTESLPLIRKFNRHSELILEGITKSKKFKIDDILKVFWISCIGNRAYRFGKQSG